MRTYRFHIIYLFCSVITFGDIITDPKIQRMPDSPTKEGEPFISLTGVLFLSAVWPLWWSYRFFKWVKQPSTQEAA